MLHKKNLISMMLAIIILFSLLFSHSYTAYAANEPNIILYIHGEKSRGGPIFNSKGSMGGGLWAPGVKQSGTLRILNNYSQRIRVTNLGMEMDLVQQIDGEYKPVVDNALYEKFAKYMKLTIAMGRGLIFSDTIYNASFFEMLYEKDNPARQGFDLKFLDKFNVAKGDYLDLKYTVRMSEEAGNDMQGMKATVAFYINSHENPESYTPIEDGEPGKDNKDRDDEIIEIPDEPILEAVGHWAHDCIATLVEHGIVTGYEDGTIRPDNYITRLEAAVLVARALKLEPDKIPSNVYIDKIPEWSRGYVSAVSRRGVFKGYPGRKFMSHTKITREQMVTVLTRAFLDELDKNVELSFSDKSQIGDWALDYVKTGVKNNIILGYPDGTFRPKDNITRAEAFTIICKLLGYHVEH